MHRLIPLIRTQRGSGVIKLAWQVVTNQGLEKHMSQFGEHMHTEHCDINLFKDELQFFLGPSRITISIIIPLALRNFFMFSIKQ